MTDHAPALFPVSSLPEHIRDRTVAERIAASDPPNTIRAYERIWSEWRTWCDHNGRDALPATADTLTAYVNHLMNFGRLDRTGKPVEPWRPLSRATVDQHIAAVRRLHRMRGHRGQPDTEQALNAIRGEARLRAASDEDDGQDARQAAPLLLDAIRTIIEHTDLATHKGCRDRALLLIGFSGMLRRSELAGIRVGDVTPGPDGLDIRLRTSKTDKDVRGVRVPVPYGAHPDTCPVRAHQALVARLEQRGLTAPAEPLFRAVTRHGDVRGRLRPADVTGIVRAAARRAGLPDPDGYSGHSMRAGGATAAYTAGGQIEAIRKQGRWAPGSTAMLAYFRAVDRWRDHPMRNVGL